MRGFYNGNKTSNYCSVVCTSFSPPSVSASFLNRTEKYPHAARGIVIQQPTTPTMNRPCRNRTRYLMQFSRMESKGSCDRRKTHHGFQEGLRLAVTDAV